MTYTNRIRKAAPATAALLAALAVSACHAGGSDTSGAAAPSKAPVSSAPKTTQTHSPSATPSPVTTSPVATSPSSAPATASPISQSTTATVRTCGASALKVTARQAADRPQGTGTGAAIIEFKNVSARSCTLKGHPTVAGAGNGSPSHNVPLKVTRKGTAGTVRLAPGAKAWVKLTFVQVQGEADGYCKSGAQPAAYPTLVVGLPGTGAYQVALDDGVFAECDNVVTATAVTTARLS